MTNPQTAADRVRAARDGSAFTLKPFPEEKKVIRSVIESIILRDEALRWCSRAETK